MVDWVCVYLKDLIPNTVLTLIYNIIKVKRRDKLNKVQTMSLCTISSAGLPVWILIKHRKYKNKSPGIKLFKDCLKLVVTDQNSLKFRVLLEGWTCVFFLILPGLLLSTFSCTCVKFQMVFFSSVKHFDSIKCDARLFLNIYRDNPRFIKTNCRRKRHKNTYLTSLFKEKHSHLHF